MDAAPGQQVGQGAAEGLAFHQSKQSIGLFFLQRKVLHFGVGEPIPPADPCNLVQRQVGAKPV